MYKRIAFIGNILLCAAIAAPAQQFWQKKPYEQWSKEECKQMLENSPWVQRYDFVEAIFAPLGQRSRPLIENEPGTSEANRQINYVAQLRSALPVRQAVVQQALLGAKRDRMSEPDKQAMRARVESFLAVSFDEAVVIHVLYHANVAELDRPLAHYWQQQTTETVKNNFSLIGSNGKSVAPVRYEALPGAGREFEVTFPRFVDGQPLVTAEDKTLALAFIHPGIANRPAARILLQFKVKDMVNDSRLIY